MTTPYIEAKKAEAKKKWNVLFAGKLVPTDPFITEGVVEQFLDDMVDTLLDEIESRVVTDDMRSPYRPNDKEVFNDHHRECGYLTAKEHATEAFQHLRTGVETEV